LSCSRRAREKQREIETSTDTDHRQRLMRDETRSTLTNVSSRALFSSFSNEVHYRNVPIGQWPGTCQQKRGKATTSICWKRHERKTWGQIVLACIAYLTLPPLSRCSISEGLRRRGQAQCLNNCVTTSRATGPSWPRRISIPSGRRLSNSIHLDRQSGLDWRGCLPYLLVALALALTLPHAMTQARELLDLAALSRRRQD
jgi:hypothetical protein